jgi:hypothetical protein
VLVPPSTSTVQVLLWSAEDLGCFFYLFKVPSWWMPLMCFNFLFDGTDLGLESVQANIRHWKSSFGHEFCSQCWGCPTYLSRTCFCCNLRRRIPPGMEESTQGRKVPSTMLDPANCPLEKTGKAQLKNGLTCLTPRGLFTLTALRVKGSTSWSGGVPPW